MLPEKREKKERKQKSLNSSVFGKDWIKKSCQIKIVMV